MISERDPRRELCRLGRHQPVRADTRVEGGIRRTHCRICGCDLMQMGMARGWTFSGALG